MKKSLWFIIPLVLFILTACEPGTYNATYNGTDYKVTITTTTSTKIETTTTETKTPPPTTLTAGTISVRPPVTKYLVKDANGTVYLVNSYSTKDKTATSPNHWTQEKGQWVYSDKPMDFANARIEGFPSGGEWGVDLPPSDYTVYIETTDGQCYAMRKGSIPVNVGDSIRIARYYVRPDPASRWYYEDGTKDLLKKDSTIL